MKTTNNNFRFTYFFLFLVLISTQIFSQAPPLIWSVRYSGPSNAQDSVVAICSDQSGNLFVTGWSSAPGLYHYIVTIRYNPLTGDSVWVNRYSGTGSGIDQPLAMTCDNSSVYITGYTFNSVNNRDIVTLKYNSSTGAQQWVKTYNGPGGGGDYGMAITVDNGGNVYSAGRTDNGGTQKMVVIKYDASGNVVSGWPFIYTGSLSGIFDEAHSVKADMSGNVYITGVSRTGVAGTDDYLTLKINSSGTFQWAKKYNGTLNGEDNAISLVLDASAQNVFVSGYATMYQANQNFMTIKYSASAGDSLAAATYNGPGGATDIVTAMTIDPSDNIYITGYSWGGSGFNFATIKYNSGLQSQWVTRSTNSGNSYPCGIVYCQGSAYVTGTTQNSGTGYDYLTCRLDASSGSQRWAKSENGSSGGNDWGSGLVVNDTNNVYVTGSSNFGTLDFYTLRYMEPVGIIPVSHNIPKNFDLFQNYPNPFNPNTTIRFDVAKSSFIKLVVYDVLGREVSTLVNEQVPAGTYEVKWTPLGNSSGIYFYKMITSDLTLTKKMVFNK